jgi:transcriptional regulator with XRE-family HTH domain
VSEAIPIPALVGRRVRKLREAAGRSQDELASAARRAGLNWTRGSVASLEFGRRGLSAEEFLLLPLALMFLDGKDHTLVELLEGASKVTRPTGPTTGTKFLRELVTGGDTGAVGARERQIAAGGGIAASGKDPKVVAFMAAREAERHVAGILDTEPEAVAQTAWTRWRRGLTEEREHRVASRAGEGASPRSLRAIRGHVTRELIDELRQTIKKGGRKR